jgi:hypothetical protein
MTMLMKFIGKLLPPIIGIVIQNEAGDGNRFLPPAFPKL